MSSRQRDASNSGQFDVEVVGDGVVSLIVALDCARIGLRTAVVSGSTWAETRVEGSARGGVLAATCAEFGVPFDVHSPNPGEEEILGIPGSPFSKTVRSRSGWRGSWRIYADRVRPLLAIGEETNLARLVRSRLGKGAVDSLVRPRVRELLRCEPEQVELADCVPELSPAMSRVGSLTLGVLELATADKAFVQYIRPHGGLRALEDAVAGQAEHFAVSRFNEHDKPVDAFVTIDLTEPKFTQALDRVIPIARQMARDARNHIFGDSDYRPIGPVDLER